MVKLHKPKLISIKKDVLKKTKSSDVKKPKVNVLKEKIQKLSKTSQIAAKDINQGNGDLKNSKKLLQNLKKTATKEKLVQDKVKKTKVTPKKKSVFKKVDNIKFASEIEKKNSTAAKTVADKSLKKNSGIKEDRKKKPEKSKTNVATKNFKLSTFEPVVFDEEKFKEIVNFENIKRISKALKVLVEKEVSEKKTSIFSDYRYFLNVTCFKIPNCPKRMVKLNLKHSLVNTETDDVVMIVPDLQRGAKVDYEPTIQHYEDKLREIGIQNIKIVPFNQLRNECSSYEAKRKFASTYDYFLCDGRIVGHVAGFCGKHFQKSRTVIHAVELKNPAKYKTEIEISLKRTSYRQLQKGSMISIPVGNHQFTIIELVENIEEVIKQLETIYPGGYANIRNIHLKIDIKGTSSLPLYLNLGSAPEEVPNVIGPREQKMLKLKKEANNILTKFNMSKTANFVKLNKSEIERKQEIDKLRKDLSKENIEDEENMESDSASENEVKKVKHYVLKPNSDDEDDSGNSNEEESEVSDEE